MSRLPKRKRDEGGGSHRYAIPDIGEDFQDVHAREGRLSSRAAASTTAAHISRSHTAWLSTTSWLPHDDPVFALDPDGELYDAAVDASAMEEDNLPQPQTKKKKSEVSKRPNVVWKNVYRSTYLDEILRWAGRGGFRTATECSDCLARQVDHPAAPQYRCTECLVPDLVCGSCCVRRHRLNPLHRIEEWTGALFTNVSLKSLGLTVQLNHSSGFCENPINCHTSMVVIHTNGLHDVALKYCGCSRAIPQHLQLLRRRFYPASQLIVKTCATFSVLDLLHKLAVTTKALTYDFYRALDFLTCNTGQRLYTSRYRALFRIIMQWRHLKLLKWGGRGHVPSGPDGTSPGELAIRCPSCPYPGINLPEGWDKAPAGIRFLYTMFACMDANFRLKNQLVSNYSQDPGLGIGMAYMTPREDYEAYVLSRASDADISTCVGFQALAQANNRFSRGLRYTGVGGVFCGRSEMFLPNGVGNLQKGERYANMDFIFVSGLKTYAAVLPLILISYDIACQWFVNLHLRMAESWPETLRFPSTVNFTPAIPKLHEPMHVADNHEVFSLNLIPGVGNSDFEGCERIWAGHNAIGNSTKTQGPGSRHDVLDDHFGFWNWLKYITLGATLMRKYRLAVAERNIHVEAHRGLTDGLDAEVVAEWEAICVVWENEAFPKKSKNPYKSKGADITEAQAKKALELEEGQRLESGGLSRHATSAPGFIVMGLEIEETQRRVRRVAKEGVSPFTALQAGGLAEQRNQLRKRIRIWEQLLPIYLPGLLQYQSDIRANSAELAQSAPHPEDTPLWLPSLLPNDRIRRRVCLANLPEIEERLRTAQSYDALESIRHTLKIKARLVLFKKKNIRGQRGSTRSRGIIDRVHEKARAIASKYRAARAAKLVLSGPGEWENELQTLADADVRGYQDANLLAQRVGRRGTLDDSQVDAMQNIEMVPLPTETYDFNLLPEERTRRDGTGETRRTLSWIWTMKVGLDSPDNATDAILRVEWSKSRARANRSKEEVQLVREEMRRAPEYLTWKANWWKLKKGIREVDATLDEGLTSFSNQQSIIQSDLARKFRAIWIEPLATLPETLPTAPPTARIFQPSETGPPDVQRNEVPEDEDEDDEADTEEFDPWDDYAANPNAEEEMGLDEDYNLYV